MKIYIATVYIYDDNYKRIEDDHYSKVFYTEEKAFDYVKDLIFWDMMNDGRLDYDDKFEDFDLNKALQSEANCANYREQKYNYTIDSQEMD